MSHGSSNTLFPSHLCSCVCGVQVHIEFTEGEDKITLEGPTKDVKTVQSQIEAIVTDLVSAECTSSAVTG